MWRAISAPTPGQARLDRLVLLAAGECLSGLQRRLIPTGASLPPVLGPVKECLEMK